MRHVVRQNAERRRATTSSARSSGLSSPNRLGVSMKRLKITSIAPRKAATSITVRRSAYRRARPSWTCSQMKTAGAVRSATTVAIRVSERHCSASSGWCRVGLVSVAAIGRD
jgi:hypothetical protein